MKKQLFGLLIGFGAALGGCAHSTPVVAPAASPSESFRLSWTANLNIIQDEPRKLFLTGETLFAYTAGNRVYAIDRAGGQILYTCAVAKPQVQLMPPVVLKNRVVFPAATSLEVYSSKGEKVSSLNLEVPIRSAAAAAGANVIIGADSSNGTGRLMQVRPDNLLNPVGWELMTQKAITAAPAFYDKIIFAASNEGVLYAMNEDRRPVWPVEGNRFVVAGPIVADLQVDDFGVYAASMDSKLYCIERVTGHLRWQYFAGRPLTTPPVVTATSVYQLVPDIGMVALNKKTGPHDRTPRWTSANVRQILSEDSKYTYVLLPDNKLAALDRLTGEVKFTSQRSDFVAFATNTKDSTIYALTTQNQIIAITPILKPGSLAPLVLLPQPLAAF